MPIKERWNNGRRETVRVSELEFNVPFQHKHGYIRDEETVRMRIRMTN